VLAILLVKFLIDFIPGLLEPFRSLRGRLFQFPLNLFSEFLLLDLLCCLGKSLFYFVADFLGTVTYPLRYTPLLGWFTLCQGRGT